MSFADRSLTTQIPAPHKRAGMDPALAKGYARQMLEQLPNGASPFWANAGSRFYVNAAQQFYQICYTKKPDRILEKMNRSCQGHMVPKIICWSKNRSSVVLDRMLQEPNRPVHSMFTPDHVRFREPQAFLYTIFCERKGEKVQSISFSGPSIGMHAIARLIQRGAATPQTLRRTTLKALRHARDAVALLRQDERLYELLIPFADGALAVRVEGRRGDNDKIDTSLPPSLSIRTYLTEDMLDERNHARIMDLASFYLEGAWSDTERYRHLLQLNRRYISPAADEPILADRSEHEDLAITE